MRHVLIASALLLSILFVSPDVQALTTMGYKTNPSGNLNFNAPGFTLDFSYNDSDVFFRMNLGDEIYSSLETLDSFSIVIMRNLPGYENHSFNYFADVSNTEPLEFVQDGDYAAFTPVGTNLLWTIPRWAGDPNFSFFGAASLANAEYETQSITASLPPATPTPIPGAVWLLGSGLAGLFALKRSRQ